MVFLTSTVINSNGNMKELVYAKSSVMKLDVSTRVFDIAVARMLDMGSLKCHL